MNKTSAKYLCIAASLLAAFALWTTMVSFIDVQSIGPQNSSVGFASINDFVHRAIGVHMKLYTITDWLGLVPLGFCFGFAILGLIQWIQRKHILRVDRSILVLGGFYLLVMAVYLFFEKYVVNYRPVLIQGYLECSYPSSTTLLTMCVMPTTLMQLRSRIQRNALRNWISILLITFTAFMVLGRLISGVHWLTDIIGAALLSAGLVMLYRTLQ